MRSDNPHLLSVSSESHLFHLMLSLPYALRPENSKQAIFVLQGCFLYLGNSCFNCHSQGDYEGYYAAQTSLECKILLFLVSNSWDLSCVPLQSAHLKLFQSYLDLKVLQFSLDVLLDDRGGCVSIEKVLGGISVTEKCHLQAAPEQSEIRINSEQVCVNCLSLYFMQRYSH